MKMFTTHQTTQKVISLQLIIAAATTFSALAFAQTAPSAARPATHAFSKLDTNGDGVISRSEAAARPKLAEHFDKLDTNKDGVLSRDELMAARKKHADAKFTRLDTDNDGRISRAEAQSAPHLAKNFDGIDTNHDGYLTREELKAAHQKRAGK